ncbi:MAG TPA: flagellar hook-associated protein FlgK [Clostridiales bacterium]|nr:flagellar hook-associated protein FlgK [Clostridiales bacterium]
MLRPTFLGYKVATSAMKVNQITMDVVGQNISNINTTGYTRQRLDISSVSINARNLKYGMPGFTIGQGVQANGVSQFRDPFLDLRYRVQSAKAGSQEVQLDALNDLAGVLDETLKDGIEAQLSDLLAQFQTLSTKPSDPVIEGVVRTSAQMLAQMFNNYSQQINTIKEQQMSYLEDGAIEKVNQLMANIARLNQEIKENNIAGNAALELNDERNLLIDELSEYLDIDVVTTPESIGGGRTVDVLSIKLKGSDDGSGENIKLVDNNKCAKLNIDTAVTDKVALKLTAFDGTTYNDFNSNIKGGKIEGYLKFLNGKGDFAASTDPFESSKGVLYYEKMIDSLANKFAEIMNEINVDKIHGEDKPLFINRDTGTTADITAGNIKISDEWAKATKSYITNTNEPKTGNDSTGATDNLLKFIAAFSTEYDFTGMKGTFQEFATYTMTRLDLQIKDVDTSYATYSNNRYQIEFARSSMSSVDMNEEGVNLLQFSKSYNAAAKLMTTLDEMLETLINRI